MHLRFTALLLLASCASPPPRPVTKDTPSNEPVDAGATVPVAVDDGGTWSGAPVASNPDACTKEPCVVTDRTVNIAAQGTEVVFLRTFDQQGRVQLLRRGEGDKEDAILAMDVKPSRSANVRQLMVDKDTVFLATSEGAASWEKSTSLLNTVGAHSSGADQLTFDASTVYWMGNDCTLRKVPRAGGKVEELAKMSVSYCGLSSLATDETNVYFSADETIHTIGKNKSGRRALLPKREARYVLGLTVDADSVYVLYSGPNGSSSAKELGKLVRVPKKGGAAKELATLQASSQAHTLTMDEKNLYFLESAERNVVVTSVPKAGGPKRVLAQVPGLGYAISAGATSVYFVAWEMGAGVRSRPKLYRIVK